MSTATRHLLCLRHCCLVDSRLCLLLCRLCLLHLRLQLLVLLL